MHSVLLVVEDEQLRASLVPLLCDIGYDVMSVTTIDEALRESVDAEVVLIDLALDRREQSCAAIERACSELTQPVLVLTSSLEESILDATAQASGYVLKPVSKRELASAVELAVFRRNAERKAAERERWYQSTLRCIVDGVITTDDAARITFMNPTAESLTGFSEGEALGRPIGEVFVVTPEGSADGGGTGDAIDNNAPVLRMIPRSGSALIVEHNASPIVEEGGSLYGIIVVFRDITERRRIEQRLALADRMTSIGTLAAGIAHELNNPLAFVTSNLEFALGELVQMRDENTPPADVLPDAIEALQEARDGAQRAAAIVKDMKVFTRTEDDPALRVDPNRAVSLAVRLMNNEIRNRAELFTRLGEVPPVLADEGKLVQVLVNVLTNAVQALDGAERRSIDIVTDGIERENVRITITDTGHGIAPEHVVRVFEPFFTTKPVGEGLGLGLSIAHTIITGFGGTISVSSELDVGTTVVITLPTANASRDAQTKQTGAVAAVVRARVLVVDDETMIGTAIRRILVKQGLEVTVEDGGRAAFDRLAAGERYDVVLCDLMMPGFSGADFYDGLDKVAPEMKSRVVFMTGNAFTPRASELFENTTNVRLDKPFVPADLTRVVGEVLRRHGDVS